ncbi:hypothetical protein B0T25DRAFT_112850 [Lasiosphaeria hispida]|uniref:Endosomal spry domain-containing protein n=1 Tax=Lasiosphaeria hispida TaxID=260671 RepID=A0AAJ0MI37_9PEZI|nr:hypothetical protein B0T25DRAFT_112850 [Lasiosphaeria hispida]
MAPAIINALIKSALSTRETPQSDLTSLGPLHLRSILVARDDANPEVDPGAGLLHPGDINNNAVFAVFGILGAAFVCGGIWFFFWAKNGGFIFKEDDWDDYKSTVLRRKGPNGTTLSGATESTILGGGSIYKDVDDGSTEDATTVVSGTTGITGITGGVSDFSGREKRRKKREQKERDRERRREEKEREKEERKRGKSGTRRKVGADGVLIDEHAEEEAKEHLRSYRHEKPARVGGLNKESEASSWGDSTNPSYSGASGSRADASTETGSTATSELINHRERTPTTTPTKKTREGGERSEKKERTGERSEKKERTGERSTGGIRKVYSTADKTADREAERLRAEAKKMQEKETSRSSQRRDFSWQRADDMALRRIDESVVSESVVSGSRAPESRIPGSWAESDLGTGSDVGTKVYKHPVHIPVSNSSTATSDFAYTEERRKKRAAGGGRRRREGDGDSAV